MIDKVTALGLSETPLNGSSPDNPEKIKESARQFEALLIGQMLKSVRESGGSWFGGGEDQASSTALGMAEEHFAQVLAAQGGLGLTKMVADGLAKKAE
jgi:Rod binding domain-containing protein